MINVMQYLDATVAKFPDKLAFSDTKSNLTFAQLHDSARRVASRLINDGLSKEPVVIFMEKSPAAIAASFGAVYAGCYYVVIDNEMPKHRIELILENLKPKVIITDELYKEMLTYEINEVALTKVRESAIDTDPIYVVFTSGSTGVPKGVTTNHKSVIDYIENLCELLQVDETSIFGNQAPLYVDACLKELYTAIKTGASAYLIPKEHFMFPIKLVEFLNEYKINTICWVSSALSMIAGFKTFDKLIPMTLRTVAFGSELFPVKNLNLWRKALPNARFINLYGPTEATGMSCYYIVDREFDEDNESEKIPIGKPFSNTEIILIDSEICIRGTCLSMGYYNDKAKTSESFVQNPFVTAYEDLIYKTGDLGSYNDRGELMFLSRKDYQIKHMGYRIELPEIEIALTRNKEISLACCLYDNEKGKIIMFYVGSLAAGEVTAYLKENLPRYMVPNKVHKLDEMPLTPNGKIDRSKLRGTIT